PEGVASEEVVDAYRGIALPMAVQICLDLQAIHASGVLVPGRGVVGFCGPSHAGKTTAAHAFGLRGALLWGDDNIALSTDGARPTSIRLPFTPNLRPASVEHFAEAGGDQVVVQAPEWAEEPLAALCVLEPGRTAKDEPVLERLQGRRAVLALLENAFVFQPETDAERRRMLESYLRLAAAVPVYRLERAQTLAGISQALDALEAALTAP
ncbi:MAG: hypothetical protein ACRDLK_12490, partial [Gaiellaceae bacterium]